MLWHAYNDKALDTWSKRSMTKSLKYGFGDKHRQERGEMSMFIRLFQHNAMVCSGVQQLFPSEHLSVPMAFQKIVHIVNGGLRWQIVDGPRPHCTSIRRSWNQVPSRDRLSSKPTTCNFATDTKHQMATKWHHSPLCSLCFMRSFAVRPSLPTKC